MAKTFKKQALGRGVSVIFGNSPDNDINSVKDKNAEKVVGNIIELELDFIEVNPFQPRTSFNEEELEGLASSIEELGVIQPITVRKIGFNKFELISGERRFRASKLAGLKTIPAYVRIADDNESLTMALVENIQRQDLDPIEIALSYQRLIEEINLTQDQMSKRVGKKRSTITNYLRLLKLAPVIQTGIRDGFISMGHGRAIITIENPEQQVDIYQEIISQNLSVRETEDLVRRIQNPDLQTTEGEKSETETSKSQNLKAGIPSYIQENLDNFSHFFGTKVSVKVAKNGKGTLTIPFSSEEDFKRIQSLLNKNV
ncbi:ParB/RepB/Spo0J family partition protein [Capnocytophaga cynodegmi]|uniref:ParB family chromosome partitioning protein n=1 Tax=Capnocytophaga cynodegmi TaxID=28189 RepID=A0A0B7HG47_9FLAO|nr:ParB/RepB/Spo0J family partition protein [Capnocytophaga cynodegmi]CEN37654.1 ParB family chromosome partitioning protein [Capnocytophaga cynodegmi]